MKKFGLDMGSSSIGWVVTEDGEIVKKGVVTFDTGMSKGQSGGYESPTRKRREARSKRNLIRARKYRKWELLRVLIEKEFVPLSTSELEIWSKYEKGRLTKFPENERFLKWLACDFTYAEGGEKYKNPYELRVKALNDKLNNHEFGRALYHLVQRRGYKDIGETDKETEKQIERRDESGFQKALDENNTIAEALVNEFLSKNKRARNQYPYRDEYRNELELICQGQGYDISKDQNGKYNDQFVKKLWKAIIWQRPLKSQKGNIGKCTLEPKKLRCPVSHPIFEIFRAWQFINTIKFYDENDNKQGLSSEHRKQLYYELFLKKDSNFAFEEIRKFLDRKFGKATKYNYPIDKDGKYDTSVSGMPVCKGLINIFGDEIMKALDSIEQQNAINEQKHGGFGNAAKIIGNYSIYDIWHAIFDFDEQFLEKFAIEKLNVKNVIRKRKNEEKLVSPLVELKAKFLQGYADLSIHAMCKIIPFLKEGYLYNEAVILAKMPEVLGENWNKAKDKILIALNEANKLYEWNKTIAEISNNLIDKYKGLSDDEKFAIKDYQYTLEDSDIRDIEKSCENKFGEKSWEKRQDKVEIIAAVKEQYQEFFKDEKRAYRELQPLSNIFDKKLREQQIGINPKALYHHSNLENAYLKKCKIDAETEKSILPKTINKFGIEVEVLPQAIIDSIKNPMFNKSMSILRRLVNELIKDGEIDKETEVAIELARELNDNNKRAAVERYQNERRRNREKYREFLKEFNARKNRNINIEESIPIFELWTEQTFAETTDENGNKIVNKNHHEILKEKEALKRYELWMEQKGQCIYTGKMISLTKLFSKEIEIMHTIPRSLLPDNTMANITVGYSDYNRNLQKQRLPKQCNNYFKDADGWGTKIEPRLDHWKEVRDNWKQRYEKNIKPFGNEDENQKNKRIQEKHYCKLHYDYWRDKLERFEAEEIKDSWARRQLVDTQMTSKYAREFLKTYFMKVAVQKGSTTAVFRKIFGFQDGDEIKSRNLHTHHAIDALVLTLIPNNSSHRERILKRYYEAIENGEKENIRLLKNEELPQRFNVQGFINEIENSTLIFNYEKDKILSQTDKIVRKRGKKQYLKDKRGKFILDKEGKKIPLRAKGDTVRTELYAQTYLGKIRDVERDDFEKEIRVENLDLNIKVTGLPKKRQNNDWVYKEGKEEFIYVVRKPISDVLSKIDDIVDPVMRELIRKQKGQSEIKDYQGNIIRHVRIRTKAGKEVKERVNYRSKHEYKNKFYSEAGSIPYAILLQKPDSTGIKREMIPVASFEVAKMYKKTGQFDIDRYIKENHSDFTDWNKQLLKVGQKVFVLKEDMEFEKRENIDFQTGRMYVITQFSEGSIWLKYHLNAQSKDEIKDTIGLKKDELLRKYERQMDIPEVLEDISITDNRARKEDYENRKFRFDTINNSFRLKRILEIVGEKRTKEIKMELDKYKAIPSAIEIERETPLLKMSKEKWNFLLEDVDFRMNLDGTIEWKNK